MKNLFLIFGLACVLSGCQSDPKSQGAQQTPQFGQPTTTIPWNRPAAWENSGQLGAMPGISSDVGGTTDSGGSSGISGGAVGR